MLPRAISSAARSGFNTQQSRFAVNQFSNSFLKPAVFSQQTRLFSQAEADALVRARSAAGWTPGHPKSYPTLEEAQSMPNDFFEMNNDQLLTLSGHDGMHGANEERLIRNINKVMSKSWLNNLYCGIH